MRRILLVVTLLLATASPAGADTAFPIEELRLVVQVPDQAGAWKIDSTRSTPGAAVLFDGSSVQLVMDDPAPTRSCRDAIEWLRQDNGGATESASSRGLDATWATDVAFVAQPAEPTDMMFACNERSGRQLLAAGSYPHDAAGQARLVQFLNAVAAAWAELADGVQRLQVDEYALTVRGRDTLWWSTPPDGGLLRLWDKPAIGVTFSRNRFGEISSDDSQTCASWMQALGAMYTATPGASFVPAQWHPDAVVSAADGGTLAVACLPRRGGGTILATIFHRDQLSAGDLDRAIRPLLEALATAAGEPPAVVVAVAAAELPAIEPTPEAPPASDAPWRSQRSAYQAYRAPSITVSYLQLTPSIDGAEPSGGLALGAYTPAVPGDERGSFVTELAGLVGYDRVAGVVVDARAGVGYQIGSPRAAFIPLVGVGIDMVDEGESTAPFQASLAAYAYAAAIIRFIPSERLAIEVRPATVQRAGKYEELEVSARLTFLRGHKRKVSVEARFRRFAGEGASVVDADLLSIGVGIGL